jgi:hypothetical protein
MAITVPVRPAEPRTQNRLLGSICSAVFRELQICRTPPAAMCSVSLRLTVHKNREPRYEFAKLSGGDVRQSPRRFHCHQSPSRHG